EEVQSLLAALVHVVDRNHTFRFSQLRDLPAEVQQWIGTLDRVLQNPAINSNQLEDYITRSNAELPKRCARHPSDFLDLSLIEIIYRILSLDPFRSWRKDPVRNLRLAKVTRLFESYHSLNLDGLRADAAGIDLDRAFLDRFYNMFISYLIEAGISDDEDEEVIVPKGYLPVMTIHQSKGLEFPFVIVGQLGRSGGVGSAQILEQDLVPFRQDLYPRGSRQPEMLAIEDDIRLLYVAYSRAEYGLILVATPQHIANHVAAPGRDAVAFRRNILAI